jgi:hypothetical protein
LSIHALEEQVYQRIMGNSTVSLKGVLRQGLEAYYTYGLTVRHNYVWNRTLTLEEVLLQSREYGAKQVTLLESVPANNYAKWLHEDLPSVPPNAKLLTSHAWGMDIYDMNGVSVAWCRFGQDDPDFDQQDKNLYINILSDGSIVFREGAYFDVTDGVFSYA